MSKKPFLVDVPVVIFVFIRTETLQLVFDAVREARPSKLYLASDGPRIGVDADKEKIKQCRKIVEDIDWDCEVHRIYFEKNQGMYEMAKKIYAYVFEREDRAILLEDDIVPCKAFFQFCAEVLEKYKDDFRINSITGMNHLGVYNKPNTDYFFSKMGSIWGIAMWRRTYELFYKFDYGKDSYVCDLTKQIAKKDSYFCKSLDGYANQKKIGGHPAGPEFFLKQNIFMQNQLYIVPRKNLIKNIGYASGSTHAADDLRKMPKGIQQVFNMDTYEIEFPMREPQYVIPDVVYEKRLKRIMAWNHPVISFYRRCEGILRRIYYGDGKILIHLFFERLGMKIKGQKRIEK